MISTQSFTYLEFSVNSLTSLRRLATQSKGHRTCGHATSKLGHTLLKVCIGRCLSSMKVEYFDVYGLLDTSFNHLSWSRISSSNSTIKGSNIASNCISKWVKTFSDKLLSDPKLSVLAKGLYFARSTPAKLPILDIVTTTEVACRNLSQANSEQKLTTFSRLNTNNF